MKKPRLSIIIPVYQVKPYLAECIDSVLHPEVPGCEIILIDDGSTDGGSELCDDFAKHYLSVKVIHQKNQGLSAARNRGLEIAQGKYVTFVDSDDRIEPRTFALLLAELEKHPDTDILEYPIFIYYQSKQAKLWKTNSESQIVGDITKEWILKDCYQHAFACNKIFRRSLFSEIRFPIGKHYEDLLTIPFLLNACQCFRMTQQGLYYYYARKESISQTISFEKSYDLFEAYYQIYKIAQEKRITDKQILLSIYLSDWLTDMIRSNRNQALEILPNFPINRHYGRQLFQCRIPLKRKIKGIGIWMIGLKNFALFYARIVKWGEGSRKI